VTRISVLMVTRWLCAPADNGARIRRAQLLGALAESFDLRVIALLDSTPDPADVARIPARVEVIDQPPFDPSTWRARLAFARRTPRAVVATNSPEAQARVSSAIDAERPALIIADEIHTAHYALGRQLPVLVEELQVGHLIDDRSLRGRITWAKNRDYHRRVLAAATVSTTPSNVEREHLRRLRPSARIEVLPNGVDAERLQPDASVPIDADRLIYSGSPQFDANRDAVIWFAESVLPIVRRTRPATRLVVTGAIDGVRVPTLAGVEFVGHVGDIADAIRRSAVSVVPLQRGGGTRIKVLESLALGTPVVATSKGVEGLGCTASEAAVADMPDGFARAVLALLDDPVRRRDQASAGRAFAIRNDWAPIRGQFVDLVGQLTRSR
jgi:polysaccharide biosynthesis protein PslH